MGEDGHRSTQGGCLLNRIGFSVLGPLEMTAGGASVALGSTKQRAVLAMLVVNRNRVVSSEALVAAVWGRQAGQEPRASLHTYVSNLRRLLNDAGVDGRSVLAAAAPGYRLCVADIDCDTGRFATSKAAGLRAAASGDFEAAGKHLSTALAQWRGRVLDDLREFEFVSAVATALDDERVGAHTALAEAEIACGRASAVVGQLEILAADYPYHEPLWTQLITAYYVAERQSDALDAYGRLKSALTDELGIRPGPTVRALHGRILRQEVLDVKRAALTAAGTAAGTFTATRPLTVASLVAVSGEVHPLTGAATRIGRLADNDVVLDDPDVSRHHAVISETGTGFVVTDLRSANGVYVQGDRIRGSVALADGDLVRICGHEFTFEVESDR